MNFLTNKINDIAGLCEKHKVKSLYAFGSVCTEHFNEQSDVDFIVSFKDIALFDYADNFFGLKEELEKALSRPVDLVTEKTIQNPYFLKVVEKTKTRIYEG